MVLLPHSIPRVSPCWIDMEAPPTGIRADVLNDPALASLLKIREEMEPGYAASRDKHSSFVAEKVTASANQKSQDAKANAAAPYLAAKKKKSNKG